MIDQPSINAWLDLWEELEEQGESPDEKAFLDKHCRSAPPELVDEFRRKLRRLNRMNARVEEAAASDTVTGEASGDTQSGSKLPTPKVLQPGFEPVKGYVLIEKLGSGGFGQVWKATGPGGHEIALKFVRLERRIGSMEQRALNVMRDVRHPHLLSCQSSWQVGKWLIIAMDLADGTLLDRFKAVTAQKTEVGIPTEELLGYMEEAAKGIDYLNEPRHAGVDGNLIGIQHRDIKPQNLLLQGGGVKVADFGLAKFIEHSITGHTGSMTPAYSAPESFDNKTSSQSDQYSLAATYCHLRGGKLPFEGSALQVMMGHQKGEPDLSMLPKLERPVVARALAKDPKDRWANCRAFAAALRAAAAGKRVKIQKRVVADPTARPLWADRRVIAGAVAAVVTLLAVPVLFSVTGNDPAPTDIPIASVPAVVGASSPSNISIPEPNVIENGPLQTADEVSSDSAAPAGSPELVAEEQAPAAQVELAPPPEAQEPRNVASSVPTQPEELPAPQPSFVSLFNGRDLNGWEQFRTVVPATGNASQLRNMPTSGAWKAEGGEIVGTGGLGHRGFLRTTRQYSDFLLRLEFRIPTGGNSGVVFRCPDGDVNGSIAGMEAQIIDDHDPERRMPRGVGQTGAIWGVNGSVPRVLRPGSEWNTMEIRCEGDMVQITVNGTRTTDVRMSQVPSLEDRPRSGYIALLAEGKTASGPWFRNIEILDLAGDGHAAADVDAKPSPPPESPLQFTRLFNGHDLSGWKEFRAKVLLNQRQPDGKYLFRIEPTRGAWAARGGELVCVSRGENAQGLIRTTRSFSDFVLSLEFRVPPACNSKLYLRLQDFSIGRPDERCVAIQISDDYGREGTEEPARRTGAIYRIEGPDRKLLHPNGAWNTLQVRCDGDLVRVTLNGETAADVDMNRFSELRNLPRSGYIGFACHGSPVDGPWFRDIQIAELPSR